MPTYEYECTRCKLKFERRQGMSDDPIADCPQCRGSVQRVISGGAGFIMKGAEKGENQGSDCSLEKSGKTCCGRDDRCGKPPCD